MLKPLGERLNLVVERKLVREKGEGRLRGKEPLRCTEHDLGSLKGVSSSARGGSSETSVASGEGGRDAQPLKGAYTQFWESGGA